MAALGAGLVGVMSAIFSDRVFNAGIALPLAVVLLAVAFMIGLTQMPFAVRRPVWRTIIIGAEFVAAGTAALCFLGVVTF